MVQEKTLQVRNLHAQAIEADSARGGARNGITHFQWLLGCKRPGIAVVSRRALQNRRDPILNADVGQAKETFAAELSRDGKCLSGPETIDWAAWVANFALHGKSGKHQSQANHKEKPARQKPGKERQPNQCQQGIA